MRNQKILSILLVFALVITMLPLQRASVQAASAHNFNFINEQYTVGSARITTNDRVTLTGTINNVNAASVKYSVYNINPSNQAVITSNENQTGNITFNGTTITIFNIQLFPGMNKITFSGTQGVSLVEESVYVEYRNSPMLYDLTAGLNGSVFTINETQTTVVHSTASMGKANTDISISGKAPNATKVSVIIGNKSNTYSISSSSDYSFVASPVNLKKGMNLVTIRVFNDTQYVETTREIAFYNGEVTFYDLTLVSQKDLNADADFADPGETLSTLLSGSTNFSIPTGAAVKVTGKAIVPIVYNSTTFDFNPNPGWTWTPASAGPPPVPAGYSATPAALFGAAGQKIQVNEDGAGYANATTVTNPSLIAPQPTDQFITVDLSEPLGTSGSGAGALTFDTSHTLRFMGWNQSKLPTPGTDESSTFFYKLRDSTLSYIQDINYIPGYTPATNLSTAESSDMENATLFSLPTGVELLIGNYDPTWVGATPSDLLELINVNTPAGNKTNADNTGDAATPKDYSYKVLPNSYVKIINVNGVDTPFLRVFVTLNKLPSAGSMKLRFQMKSAGTHTAVSTDPYNDIPITLLYGPFVKYTGVFDGMQIEYDTTMLSTAGINSLIVTTFQKFAGELFNVPNISEILYAPTTSPVAAQTAFLYINNTEMKLIKDTVSNKFVLDTADGADADTIPDSYQAAFNALNKTGDNFIKFVYRTSKNNYESTIKVTIVPTNLPVIPAPSTDGVYPYSSNLVIPLANDPNFPKKGPLYTTKEAEMNVYGTFDFINLGSNEVDVEAKLSNAGLGSEADNYMLVISSPDFASDLVWNMGTNLFTSNTGDIINGNGGETNPPSQLRVIYNYDTQSFSFILTDQKLPFDGSSKVYSIAVYNGGLNGPRATYRLEVDPTSIPYTIITPRSEKRTVNQSFVEVILTSPGADSVTINKVPATKVTYLDYGVLVGGLPTEVPAFKAIVKGLKPNKENKIDVEIKNANESIKDSFPITFAPENIPGAQDMLTMKSSLKVFSGQLNLTFPGGTNLIRRDYNVADNLKGQVYKDNNVMFAIANPTDGVVDRHDFETIPGGYDMQLKLGQILFTSNFPQRFIKASPVFWVDAGQADDPTTAGYDPVTAGIDPYPLAIIKGDSSKLYNNRSSNRELIPSKQGTLTLSYDPNMRESVGTLITVFRFDPFIQQWENIGGTVDSKKNTIKVPFSRFGYYVVGKVGSSFNDVTSHPYARDAMEAIYAKGIMNALDPSGAFGADQYVTRGEFSRMLVRALELPLNFDGPNHFVDVPNTGNAINMDALWDYRYIETAARAGFVRGTLPKVFQPDTAIVRQDATVMLAKALNIKTDTDSAKVRKALQKSFKDEADIEFYAKPSVAAILKKGFIGGSLIDVNDPTRGSVFEPKARLLRSDAAIIIAKVMVDLKKLPKLYTN
ncbi:S-layer homology domain-containing protein [Cohnella silvisoli]|uniref:S-layer homology domain-containing protein n=1 Tax=Cohnella silvisoli TaxID=2873699 RepID=A0ABV1KPS7_9BACL|nr:S-layer homology domain-containing protein [Cohnella silvisoli]MCD9022283.1 S-layer homology domain-containing protein [Cohnella silvisoli]